MKACQLFFSAVLATCLLVSLSDAQRKREKAFTGSMERPTGKPQDSIRGEIQRKPVTLKIICDDDACCADAGTPSAVEISLLSTSIKHVKIVDVLRAAARRNGSAYNFSTAEDQKFQLSSLVGLSSSDDCEWKLSVDDKNISMKPFLGFRVLPGQTISFRYKTVEEMDTLNKTISRDKEGSGEKPFKASKKRKPKKPEPASGSRPSGDGSQLVGKREPGSNRNLSGKRKPSDGSRPSGSSRISGSRLSGGSRSSVNRPSGGNRPSDSSRPSGSRPSARSRPSGGSRPSDSTRPSGSRPSGESRPSDSSRPSWSRPSAGNRPSGGSRSRGGSRPSGSRPNSGNRPGGSSRPGGSKPSNGRMPSGSNRPSGNRLNDNKGRGKN